MPAPLRPQRLLGRWSRSAVACLLAVLALAAVWPAPCPAAETRVTLEVVATSRFAIAGAQAWARELGELGFASVRIRLADDRERPQPELTGEPGDPLRKAVGVLIAGDMLVLPEGKYRRGEGAAIKAWLTKIQQNTPEPEPQAAFGLSAKELVEMHTQLSRRVRMATRGKPVAATANALVRELPTPVHVSQGARQRIAEAEPIRDELEGLSIGTALAAIVRPLGLGLAPARRNGTLVLEVADFRELNESWPIGWPPQEKEAKVVPKLLEFLPVEINKTPIADTIAAIAGRLELPVLYDHNAMARHRIDPWSETTTLPETRTYYRRILDRTLIPAGLKAELRVDEADKPFLWIATVKP